MQHVLDVYMWFCHIFRMMANHAKTAPLADLADIAAGHPLRGAVDQLDPGNIGVIQMRNADPGTGVDWANVARVAVVVPHGALFRGSSEGAIRRRLIEENLLDTVIGLPEKLFYGTSLPAAIRILRKAKPDRDVLFIDASRAFKSGKNQNRLTEAEIDLAAVRAERPRLKAELVEGRMDGYLKELGRQQPVTITYKFEPRENGRSRGASPTIICRSSWRWASVCVPCGACSSAAGRLPL